VTPTLVTPLATPHWTRRFVLLVAYSGPEVLFETCVAMKFVDDDDDDIVEISPNDVSRGSLSSAHSLTRITNFTVFEKAGIAIEMAEIAAAYVMPPPRVRHQRH